MKAYFQGGPLEGQTLPHPYTYIYRHAIPRELTITDFVHDSLDKPSRLEVSLQPNYGVARYQFTGLASASLDGTVGVMFYKYIGME